MKKWKERMFVALYLVASLVVVILVICVIKRPGRIFATSYIFHFLPIHLATLQPWKSLWFAFMFGTYRRRIDLGTSLWLCNHPFAFCVSSLSLLVFNCSREERFRKGCIVLGVKKGLVKGLHVYAWFMLFDRFENGLMSCLGQATVKCGDVTGGPLDNP